MKVWVLIPAYNEAGGLTPLLEKVKAKGLPVLVVDDGSSDATYEAACGLADKVLRHEKNMGKGEALKDGLACLSSDESVDYVVTMDADGQHSPDDLDLFLREASRGKKFIVGNRMADPVGMPWLRVITNKFMSWLISRMTGQRIPDSQCGFRLLSRDVFSGIKIETGNFEVESEMLVKAAAEKVPIDSVPIKSIYSIKARSKINPVIDTLRFIKFLICLKMVG
jgi:glycosyltransferase involved in cell wall biosynthesis